MTNSSKSYKVQLFYRILYSCSFDVLNKNKSPLLQAFLQKELGIEKASSLNCFHYSELIEQMITDFSGNVSTSDYLDVAIKIRFNERYLTLRNIAKEKEISTEQIIVNFRMGKEYVKDIYQIRHTTLGDVIEKSIALYVVSCDEITYELIRFAFENYDITTP
ncbi:MAG: hypothetical protein N2A99_06380 [Carnobacterium alterfunditum]